MGMSAQHAHTCIFAFALRRPSLGKGPHAAIKLGTQTGAFRLLLAWHDWPTWVASILFTYID